jgi:hypothetical protein
MLGPSVVGTETQWERFLAGRFSEHARPGRSGSTNICLSKHEMAPFGTAGSAACGRLCKGFIERRWKHLPSNSVGTIRSADEPRMCVADHEAWAGSRNHRDARCVRSVTSARSLYRQPVPGSGYRSSSETMVDSVGFVVPAARGIPRSASRDPVRAARGVTYRTSYLVGS